MYSLSNTLIMVDNPDVKTGIFIIPDEIINIGKAAFARCTDLAEITIPPRITRIEESTFAFCRNLKSVTLSKGLTCITKLAFYDCKSLESIIIPQGVINIEELAFYNCDKLFIITLPQGITIAKNALSGLSSLSIIVIDAETPQALQQVKKQLPMELQSIVISKKEYMILQKIKLDFLQSTFKSLLTEGKIDNIQTILTPIRTQSFFSLLPAALLYELNFYKHPTYASALMQLPGLNVPVTRDEEGEVMWNVYQDRFAKKFSESLMNNFVPHTISSLS